MGKLAVDYGKTVVDLNGVKVPFDSLKTDIFKKFSPSILELGTVSDEGKNIEGVAVIFDLEGFTDFCNQIDPHLVVPEFLRDFLEWLFKSLKDELVHSKDENNVLLWCRLPFFAKFMGDGVLFLWDTTQLAPMDLGNLVISMHEVCQSYHDKYYSKAEKQFAKPPKRLRCGIARGNVMGIGNGNDYVGACINSASRLQKLSNLSFAFSRRGFNLTKHFKPDWSDHFILVQAPIRGIGDKEPVYVIKNEFEQLSKEQKKLFSGQ